MAMRAATRLTPNLTMTDGDDVETDDVETSDADEERTE